MTRPDSASPLVMPSASPSPSALSLSPLSPAGNVTADSDEQITRWDVLVAWSKGSWADWHALLSLRNNFTFRVCCVLLMLKCAFVALTGRGVVSIIQAIGGVIFSIEGFWGAVKYDSATVKRFLIFLVCYFFVAVTIAIINLETLTEYCSTATDDQDRLHCMSTARIYSWILLGLTLGLVPLMFGVGVIFFLAIESNETTGHLRRHGKDYEMAEIVDRMGFSSD